MVVVLAGPPCSGKSTAGAWLAAALPGIHLHVDAILTAIIPVSDRRLEDRRLAYEIAARATKPALDRGLSAVLDCTYSRKEYREQVVSNVPADVRLVGITRDPRAPKVSEFGLDACYSGEERDVCLAQTDVLILCARLSRETQGLIDAKALQALRPGAYLVNAARGALIDYEALYSALTSAHLAGAGLDVYWREPIAPDDPLLALPNVIATPHIAGVTDRSYEEIAEAVATNIDRFRRQEAPLNRAV